MTNQEQAYFWLTQAEQWRQVLGDAEDRFKAALTTGKTKFSEDEINYRIWSAAKDNFNYQRAGRKLEATERRATMYALFALLEK